ncbi:MAG TPA: MFS transporter [Gaiellaceae bacterium]|nr:MFS transporter [Gaiellaceae bacterium]
MSRLRSGFWPVVFAFLVVMAFATLPSPLYGLYRERDGLSSLTITIVYAIWAASTIVALVAVPFVAERIGRRGVMFAAVATMMVSAAELVAWKTLPGLLLGRLLTGFAVGMAAGTAIVYLIELSVRADSAASPARARTIGTSVNVGALGIGPLVAGCLAAWVGDPLSVPYLVWIALGAVALAGLVVTPETGAPTAAHNPFTVALPASAGAAGLAAFAANGLFAGLSGLLLATVFHQASHALAGATLFVVFSAGVVSQLLTTNLRASRVFALGTASMLVGLVLLVTSVRLAVPSLALFLVSGALIGAGVGAVYKGTAGLVLDGTAPENRVAMTAELLIALFVGLSIPVVGAGVALDRGVSASTTVLVFAALVGLGVAGAGWGLLGHKRASPAPAA